jgi:hypothetical protein
MTPSIRHIAELARIATGRHDVLPDLEIRAELEFRDVPLIGRDRWGCVVTSDEGLRVLGELVCTLGEQT